MAQRWREWTGGNGLGTSWLDDIHPEDVPRALAAWSEALGSGQPLDQEMREICRLRHPDALLVSALARDGLDALSAAVVARIDWERADSGTGNASVFAARTAANEE